MKSLNMVKHCVLVVLWYMWTEHHVVVLCRITNWSLIGTGSCQRCLWTMYLNLPRFTSCTSFTCFALAARFNFVMSFLSTLVSSNILGRTLRSGVSRLCSTTKTTLSFCLTMLFIFRRLVSIWPLRWFPAFLMLCLHFVNLCRSLLYCSCCCSCCTKSLHNWSLTIAVVQESCNFDHSFGGKQVLVFFQTLLINFWIL